MSGAVNVTQLGNVMKALPNVQYAHGRVRDDLFLAMSKGAFYFGTNNAHPEKGVGTVFGDFMRWHEKDSVFKRNPNVATDAEHAELLALNNKSATNAKRSVSAPLATMSAATPAIPAATPAATPATAIAAAPSAGKTIVELIAELDLSKLNKAQLRMLQQLKDAK